MGTFRIRWREYQARHLRDSTFQGESVRSVTYIFDHEGEFAEIETSPDEDPADVERMAIRNTLLSDERRRQLVIEGDDEFMEIETEPWNVGIDLSSESIAELGVIFSDNVGRVREGEWERQTRFVPGDVSITVTAVTEPGLDDGVSGPPCDYCERPTMRPWLRNVPESRWLCLNCQDGFNDEE